MYSNTYPVGHVTHVMISMVFESPSQISIFAFLLLLLLFHRNFLSGKKKISSRSSRTIYVGNLPGDIREREVEDLFSKYGPVVQIDLKIPPRPPGYAFVEFEDARDADDAIYGRDGYDFDGHHLRVELAHGGRRSSHDSLGSYSGRGRGGRGGGDGGGRERGPSRRSEYRVVVSGLPSSASWQDLKDHMRKGGEVCFSQMFRDGRGTTGIVDYTSYEDMKYAVREYDSRRDSRSPSRGRSYSKSRSRGRSPSRSRSRSRSRSKSRSPKAKSSRRSRSLQNLHRDLLALAPALSQGHCLHEGIKGLGETAIQHGNIGFLKLDLFLGLLQISFKVQKEASKSPSKQLSPAKSPICGRSKSRSRSPSR
ncbi:unnamed protein product [Arabidopsis thaliana]|uniref:RRM domain-containing protein n=1 Tax=Arabidopsis thaliana TaxID=3702 RepID=A0A5S9XP78_ARATH|nr:unnamed protein product [Arabidopsis thaliana]